MGAGGASAWSSVRYRCLEPWYIAVPAPRPRTQRIRILYVRILSLGEVWLLKCRHCNGRGARNALLWDALHTWSAMRGADLVHFILTLGKLMIMKV